MGWEGAYAQTLGDFYVAVVWEFLLFKLEAWLMSPRIDRTMGVIHLGLRIRLISTSKGADFSYDLDCVISFYLWILSAFCGYIHILWILSAFRGYSPYYVDIIRISHNTSYLARYVRYVLRSFVLFVDIMYIGNITSYLDTSRID